MSFACGSQENLNTETPEEVALLSGYASELGRILEGYWSVDFCCDRDGKWWFIDAAEGNASYHWPDCSVTLEAGR